MRLATKANLRLQQSEVVTPKTQQAIMLRLTVLSYPYLQLLALQQSDPPLQGSLLAHQERIQTHQRTLPKSPSMESGNSTSSMDSTRCRRMVDSRLAARDPPPTSTFPCTPA